MYLPFFQLISYLLSLPCLLFALFLFKNLFTKSNTNKNEPPSPPRLPIIGNLHQMGESPHKSFHSLSKKYGKLMLLHIGNKPILVASTPQSAKEILKTQDLIFCNRPNSIVTNKLFYGCRDIAFCHYGEQWKMLKSLGMMKLLSNKRVQSYKNIREDEVCVVMNEIKGSHSLVVNLSELIKTQTYNLICMATFGRKYGSKDHVGDVNFKEYLDVIMELLGVFMVGDYVPWLSWIDRVKGLEGRLDRVAKDLDEMLDKVIQYHQNCLDVKNKNDVNYNFVESLLEEHNENKDALTLSDIKAVILDVFAAATDPTFILLEWTMTELIRHPRVMKELQQEVRKFVGPKGCKLMISEDDLDKMTYLKVVIKESLRLHPPAPLLVFREPSQDVKINDFDISAGTRVFINAWAIHRDPNFWDEPLEFRPERFLDTTCSFNFKGQDNFNYIPFGGGRRICPGMDFAVVNAELMLANLVSQFNWEMPPECRELDMNESVGITVHKRDPLMLIATPYVY